MVENKLSDKFILADENNEPIPKSGDYGYGNCVECSDFYKKKITTQRFCSKKCNRLNYGRIYQEKVRENERIMVK